MIGLIRYILRLFGGDFLRTVEQLRSLPESAKSITKPELIARLRALAERRPRTREEQTQLAAELFVLGERIERSPVCNETPHNIWHFLSDADIRFKDARYAKSQLDDTLAILKQWERTNA
jgi:hypothetical protein